MFGPGYDGSLNYVVRVLRNAGYDPQITPFNFPFWEEAAPPVLNQVTRTATSYVPGDASLRRRARRRLTSDTPGVDFMSIRLAERHAQRRPSGAGSRDRDPARRAAAGRVGERMPDAEDYAIRG